MLGRKLEILVVFTHVTLQAVAEAAGYDEETVLVGRALQKDFEQRGVHLIDQDQSRALQLSQDIATLGMAISKPQPLSE